MENFENSFKMDVIRHVNLPFIQEEMTLWWVSDETARKTGNNANMAFLATTMTLKTQSCKLDAEKFDIVRHRA